MSEITLTNVTVMTMNSPRIVQEADSADMSVMHADAGVIVNRPLHDSNGGPQIGNNPAVSHAYSLSGTDAETNQKVTVKFLRYLGKTPGGNAQYTTE